jgi:regulator of sigma E protease
MEVLVRAGQFLLSLSILIVLHEMGHFLMAKAFKTRVEKFYLFFDPGFSLFKKKIGETEYGIGWLPLGGYVKISGMIDESMDKQQMASPPQPYEFRSKKAWQRLLIMLGGVLVNFLLALFLYIIVFFTWGERYVPMQNLSNGIMVDSLGRDLGLRNGDKVLQLDGRDVVKWEAIPHDLLVYEVNEMTVERDGQIITVPVDEAVLPRLLKSDFPILPRVPFEIYAVYENTPAANAGILAGDRIVAVNDSSISFYDQYVSLMKGKKNTPIDLSVIRDGREMTVHLTTDSTGMIGIRPLIDDQHFYDAVEVRYSLLQSIPAGINKGFETTKSYLKSLQLLLKPKKYKAHESLGGFIKIGSIFPPTWNWQSFWNLTAFLSIILAIMNILPIPALDGGHVMFVLYEMISGRKPGDKFLEYAQIVGMVILLSLLLYANLNDIIGLFRN